MKNSAGIIYYRYDKNESLELFLAHSTGNYPYYSFPKGEVEEGDSLFETALREFAEETGHNPSSYDIEDYISLGSVLQNATKIVHAYAIEADIDPSTCESNECEYPQYSGIFIRELDDYKWFTYQEAYDIINPAQRPLLKTLLLTLSFGRKNESK